MTSFSTDIELFEEIVGDAAIPCDMADPKYEWRGPSHGEATWQVNTTCPSCGWSAIKLVCASCKHIFMHSPYAGVCIVCDEPFAPLRRVVTFIKRI